MIKSEQINELACALAKAQSEIKDASKDRNNPFLKYNYADLSSVLEISRPVLSKNNLALTQLISMEDNKITIESLLIHSSGQYIGEKSTMPFEEMKGLTKAQACGVIITYLRRYSASALIGITQTDTDGSNPAHAPENTGKKTRPQPEPKQFEPKKEPEKATPISMAKKGLLDALIEYGIEREGIGKFVNTFTGKAEISDEEAVQITAFIKAIKALGIKAGELDIWLSEQTGRDSGFDLDEIKILTAVADDVP